MSYQVYDDNLKWKASFKLVTFVLVINVLSSYINM